MTTYTDKAEENKSQSNTNKASQKQNGSNAAFQFVNNRPEAIAQRKLHEVVNNSSQTKHATQLQTMADNHSLQQQLPVQKKENNTGLPDNLKSGIENLSGYSMDDVKVHYNSDKPAQLNAHAYAQGTDIHMASGQEKHLPHEAWHVVQQKQGRVKPTKQMKGKVNVNDDAGLEKEADIMGTKALQMKSNLGRLDKLQKNNFEDNQLKSSKNIQLNPIFHTSQKLLESNVIQSFRKTTLYNPVQNDQQRVKPNMDIFEDENIDLGYAHLSRTANPNNILKNNVNNYNAEGGRITGQDNGVLLNQQNFHANNTNNHHLTLENSFCAALKYQIEHMADGQTNAFLTSLEHNKLVANAILSNNTDNLNCHPTHGHDQLSPIINALSPLAFTQVNQLRSLASALYTTLENISRNYNKTHSESRKGINFKERAEIISIILSTVKDIRDNIGAKKTKINNITSKTQANIRHLSNTGFGNANQAYITNGNANWGQNELTLNCKQNLKNHITEKTDANWWLTRYEVEPILDNHL